MFSHSFDSETIKQTRFPQKVKAFEVTPAINIGTSWFFSFLKIICKLDHKLEAGGKHIPTAYCIACVYFVYVPCSQTYQLTLIMVPLPVA